MIRTILATSLYIISINAMAFESYTSFPSNDKSNEIKSKNSYESTQEIINKTIPHMSMTFNSDGSSSSTTFYPNGNSFTCNSDGSTSSTRSSY